MVLLIVMGMSEQSALSESGSSMADMLNNMPKSIKALMGGGAFDTSTAIGYYSMIHMYLILMTTIHAVMIGAGIISKEEQDKTFEFLMAKPVSRFNIVSSKLLAAFTNVLIFNLVTLVTSIVLIGSSFMGDVVKLMLGMFLLQILFLSIGAFLAAYKSKSATGLGTGILLITFFLSIIIDMVDHITFLKYLTPFKYFDAKTLIIDAGFNPVLVLLTLGLTSVLTYFTFKFYNNRDLGH
jgi:ABC-2 type transport system permease protein